MTQEIQYHHLLAGLVRCQPCGTEMTAIHDPDNRYVCPTLMERGPDDCTTPPIDAEYLDRLVATRLVENVLTNENRQTVIKIIQEQCGEKSLRHRAELETERATFAEVAGQVQELNDAKTRLEAQAIEAKKQLDIQEFVSDEGRIRESARNIDTYLGAVDKETVREMLRTLIREVLVGPGAATLRYTIPMPSGGPGK